MEFTFEDARFIKLMLHDKLSELSENAFQRFFQDVMSALQPDFVDVRAHGHLGDLGADGLSLHDGKLYACYGPRTADAAAVRRKFRADLASAIRQRPGQFEVFVYVHNDRGGIHPTISELLAHARGNHTDLRFEVYGPNDFLDDILLLRRDQVERLLGSAIPVTERVYQVGLADLEPLLRHLAEHRRKAGAQARAREVPPDKLDYNQLSTYDREALAHAFKYTHLVEGYYQQRNDPTERDEVAQGINDRYQTLRQAYDDPSEVIWKMQEHIAGNARRHPEQEQLIMVVLAHFFESCDLFKEPPTGWRQLPSEEVGS